MQGLVPYDNARARGKNSKAQLAKQAAAEGVPKRRQRRTKENIAPSNPSTTLHYPSECAFGPQKRGLAPRPNDTAEDLPNEPDLGAVTMMDTFSQTEMNVDTPGVNLAAEIMSAEMVRPNLWHYLVAQSLCPRLETTEELMLTQLELPAR